METGNIDKASGVLLQTKREQRKTAMAKVKKVEEFSFHFFSFKIGKNVNGNEAIQRMKQQ